MRGLNAGEVAGMLRRVAEGVIARTDLLTQADKAIGDGDHGIGMARGFEAVLARLGDAHEEGIDEVFAAVGTTLMASIGGASGAVFGTLFSEGGRRSRAESSLTPGSCPVPSPGPGGGQEAREGPAR